MCYMLYFSFAARYMVHTNFIIIAKEIQKQLVTHNSYSRNSINAALVLVKSD